MKTVVVITGPTAGGKSDLIASLPGDSPVEIINADSRQVYREMDIATAMPSAEERARFPHHLFAFLSPDEKISAGRYCRLAAEAIREIHSRGRIPILVGGSFFYIKSLWDGLAEIPDIPETTIQYTESLSAEALRRELSEKDGESLRRIGTENLVRLRRALAVTLATSRPFSSFELSGGIGSEYEFEALVIDRPREELHERIRLRCEMMLRDRALLRELENLLAGDFRRSDHGLVSIGYREIFERMDREQFNSPAEIPDSMLPDLVAEISRNTRKFAKRQYTWFRSDPRLKTIDYRQGKSHLSGFIGRIGPGRADLT